jgi:hypothetical protein
MIDRLLEKTALLNFDHPAIQKLFNERGWKHRSPDQRKRAIYAFVRDEIRFGYNRGDAIPASEVLQDGYGQCNTKGILLMALLRAGGIPCRFHGFYIDKVMQKGAATGLFYALAPRKILHSWVEVMDGGKPTILEGFILDKAYMRALATRLEPEEKKLCGFGASTLDLPSALIDWDGASDTYIQNESITDDLGIYDSPDAFFSKKGENLSGLRKWIFENFARHKMNENVSDIRLETHDQRTPRCGPLRSPV